MKIFFGLIGLTLLLLICLLVLRTLLLKEQPTSSPLAALPTIDQDKAAQRLAGALRFATIADADPSRGSLFRAFHDYLIESYPAVHAQLRREIIGGLGLLYTWPGTDGSLKPILLMAHQDVVPVDDSSIGDWTHAPFDGAIADEFVWGRGALDDKSSLVAILEAVETLLGEGVRPRRTIYLAFGQDEEVGGNQGNARMAEVFRERGVRFEFVLDEGGFVTEGLIQDVSSPVALVGIAEKGYLTLELSVAGEGGHSSVPGRPTTIGRLSRALSRLESKPFPSDLRFVRALFKAVAPEMPFAKRLALANLWLFAPLVETALAASPEMAAMLHTTAAPTQFDAGVKENVLPQGATAVVNFRVLPGENTQEVIERVRNLVADDEVTIVARRVRSEPSPVAAVDSDGYRLLERTIRQTAAEEKIVVAPYLVVGATDSRYYNGLADNIYRYAFLRLGPQDIKRIHGTDERIAVRDFRQLIQFYCLLLRNGA